MSKLRSYYPWLVFILGSGFVFYKYGLQISPSVMVNPLMAAFHLSGLNLGNLAAFYFYAYLLMQIPVGILLDRFNPVRLITLAILICACGAWLFSSAHILNNADIGRLLIGIGGAFSAVGTMKLITIWFPANRFALVSGLMMTAAMLGAICGEAPLSALVNHVGWRDSMFILAIVGLVYALIFSLLVRHKPENKIKPNNTPPLFSALQAIMTCRQAWLISLYSGLAYAPISAFGGLWGVPYLMTRYAVNRTTMAGLISLAFVGFAIGSPLAGWISDKISRRKPIMLMGTTTALISLCLILYLPPMPLIILGLLLLLFGFASGCFFVSFATMRELNSPQLQGTSIGFINMFNALCGAAAEPLIGKLLDAHWQHGLHHGIRVFSEHNYQMALATLPIALACACLCLLRVKETYGAGATC